MDFGGGHPSEVLHHIKAGRMRALAQAFEKRDASQPDVPSFKKAGYDLVTGGSVKGVAAPKGTPKEVVSYLVSKFKAVADDPEFQKIMRDIGQPMMYQGPDENRLWIKEEAERFGKLLKLTAIETKEQSQIACAHDGRAVAAARRHCGGVAYRAKESTNGRDRVVRDAGRRGAEAARVQS